MNRLGTKRYLHVTEPPTPQTAQVAICTKPNDIAARTLCCVDVAINPVAERRAKPITL
jgi:hypothetical protein